MAIEANGIIFMKKNKTFRKPQQCVLDYFFSNSKKHLLMFFPVPYL